MTNSSLEALYGQHFRKTHLKNEKTDAEVIVSLFDELIGQQLNLQRVVDIGCGLGFFAAEFKKRGVPWIRGYDHEGFVQDPGLAISPQEFRPVDLNKEFPLERCDLAICLEVLEHLEEKRAFEILQLLMENSQLILFSAASPGQGGRNHVNCKHLAEWAEWVNARGWQAVDCLRPYLMHNENVSWWYRQNIVVLMPNGMMDTFGQLKPHCLTKDSLILLHPSVLNGIIYWEKQFLFRHPSRLIQTFGEFLKNALNWRYRAALKKVEKLIHG